MFATKGQYKEMSISAEVMRVTPPEATDPRQWKQHQCPHCSGIFWAWPRGIISYWHRNPIRRALYMINSFRKG